MPYLLRISLSHTSTSFNGARIFSTKAFFDTRSSWRSTRNANRANSGESLLRALTPEPMRNSLSQMAKAWRPSNSSLPNSATTAAPMQLAHLVHLRTVDREKTNRAVSSFWACDQSPAAALAPFATMLFMYTDDHRTVLLSSS